MIYYPEDRDEILSKRVEKEIKKRTYHPDADMQAMKKQLGPASTPLRSRLSEYRKMKETIRSKRNFIDEFLDSEMNQKIYGFTTKIVNGIREIYYDGDMDMLNDAIYGPQVVRTESDGNSTQMIRLLETDGQLYARWPNSSDEIAVKIIIGDGEFSDPSFTIVTETGAILTRLSLTEPAYYPDETACKYLIDMRGLTELNRYVRNNFQYMLNEWNHLHPNNVLSYDTPLPNYRFLASYAYSEMKKAKLGET